MATVTDPVCGMEIDSAAAAASEEYRGRPTTSAPRGATSGLWPRRRSTPSERVVRSSWFALAAQAGVGDEAALFFASFATSWRLGVRPSPGLIR
jgi:hypothetical protein